MSQHDKIIEYLKEHKKINKDFALKEFGIASSSGFYNSITLLRMKGYTINHINGVYTLQGYKRPKKHPKPNKKYVEARLLLIPEAEKIANELHTRKTMNWDRAFCTAMCELSTKHLGTMESWQS